MNGARITTVLFLTVGIGWLIGSTVTTKYQFDGHIVVETFTKDTEHDPWVSLVKLNVPKVSFLCELGELSYKNDIKVKTKYDFIGITDSGERVLVRLKDAAAAHFNPTNGSVSLEVVFNVIFNSGTTQLPIRLTTDAADSPSGTLHGKQASLDPSTGLTAIAMVGGGMITAKAPGGPNSVLGQESPKNFVQTLTIVKGEGHLQKQN